ncbi:peptidoglycan-binding domain-containing protein [Streptomyces geranii]|uniref:peptidoglycan-binding domain-containing protein n=1 Tax=Streptomyces geranii TaxID=2058923 RepID=UPI000D02971D|nr:peptidoglycan-binding protein [Streptomyces geranii]
MNDPKGHVCPECGTPRGADNTPSCACAERAADAHIENRTAEAAAAEDFDPLRIRPYVELTPESQPPPPPQASDVTMPLPPIREPDHPDGTPTTAIPQPPADYTGGYATEPDEGDEDDERNGGSRARPKVLLLGVAGAVVAVLAAGGLAGGMFTYDKPSRDDTAAQDVRESVPVTTTSSVTTPTPSSSPTESESPTLTPTPTLSEAPAPAPTRSTAAPTPSSSPTPTQAPTTAQATGTISPSPGNEDKDNGPVLRPGDQGDEVLELQLRLRQLALYVNDLDGVYDDNVENAVTAYQTTRNINTEEQGVYDRTTRERLESETTEP